MVDSRIPSMSYGDFGRLLMGKTGQERYPYYATIEVTPHCNLKCVHCYVSHCNLGEHVLDYAEWTSILDAVSSEGCLYLLITGGEPMLRPDFLRLYAYAKKKGFIITLFTNGTLITDEIADYLEAYCPKSVEVTLYGATRETYEKLTGIPGSFDRCLQGITRLVERKIPVKLKTVAITINKNEIKAMEQYAEKWGIPFRWDAAMTSRLDHGKEPTKFRLSPEEVIELEAGYPRRVSDWQEFCKTHLQPRAGDSLFTCNAGKTSFFIDSFGRLSPCLDVRFESFDLRHGSFHEGWHSFLAEMRNQKVSPGNKCHNCELLALCGCCPGNAELETSDPNGRVEWLCRVAHMRVSSFDLDAHHRHV